MPDPLRYVPILKLRAAEGEALATLSAVAADRITPLLEIPPVPWDYDAEAPAKTLDEHLAAVLALTARSWRGGRVAFVDVRLLDEDRPGTGVHPLVAVGAGLHGLGVPVVPVTDIDPTPADEDAVTRVAALHGRGLCVRVAVGDLPDLGALATRLPALLTALGATPAGVDLVLDFGSAAGNESLQTARTALGLLPDRAAWRTLTVAAGAFPTYASDAAGPDATGVVPRTDWTLWQNLAAAGAAGRRLDYGDYTVTHPDLTSMDPRFMTVVPSVRYTTATDWLVMRGHRARGTGKWAQMRDISKRLVARPEYAGAGFSPGDAFITACADGTGGTGGPKEWRTVGTSHHLHLVVAQLATASGPATRPGPPAPPHAG